MNVTLCSTFRNASGYLDRHANQVFVLGDLLRYGRDDDLEDHLHVIWCEGDSEDSTHDALVARARAGVGLGSYTADIFQYHHGGPDYGSVVNAERFANIAKVCNEIWRRIPIDADAVIFVESDLIWEPATMLALLDDLEHVPAVSPMVMLRRDGFPEGYWYDSWAFSRKGARVNVMPPYFDDLDADTDLLELDTAGSCMAMRASVARYVYWPAEDVFRGVCRQIRERGDSIYLDANQKVIHP